jgi:hypothetical protein
MSDIAIESQGTNIYVGATGSPADYALIPEVRSIGGPDGQANMIDTTDLASTAKEFRPGLKDEGQIRLGIFYVPTNTVHQTLRSAYSARTQKQFKIVYTDGEIWEFDGYVTGFSVNNEVDNVTRGDVTIKITGAIREVN